MRHLFEACYQLYFAVPFFEPLGNVLAVVIQFKRTVMVWKRDHAPALAPPAPVDAGKQ